MTIFGVIVTAIYIFIIAILRWSSFSTLQTMPLNEFGDFFAGVFGPLMLFWLILGYVQQQKELRQNTKALELQADELRKSVEQHKELVEVTKEQVRAELKSLEMEEIKSRKEAHPSFSITNAGWAVNDGHKFEYKLSILNSGQPATDVAVTTVPIIKQAQKNNTINYFSTGQTFDIEWDNKNSGDAPPNLKVIINCRDSYTRPYSKQFDLVLDKNKKYHTVGVASVG